MYLHEHRTMCFGLYIPADRSFENHKVCTYWCTWLEKGSFSIGYLRNFYFLCLKHLPSNCNSFLFWRLRQFSVWAAIHCSRTLTIESSQRSGFSYRTMHKINLYRIAESGMMPKQLTKKKL